MDQAKIVEELSRIVGKENVLVSEMQKRLFGYDASLYRANPDCVVLPNSTEDVSRVVAFAHKNGIRVVARGAGTNLSGGSVPSQGGIVLQLSRMNKILEIDTETSASLSNRESLPLT